MLRVLLSPRWVALLVCLLPCLCWLHAVSAVPDVLYLISIYEVFLCRSALCLPMLVVRCRAPACNVVLEHLSISRQHAALTVDSSGSVCLMDLGSAHGTKLGDAWLKPQQQRTAAVGTTIQFGASTRTYRVLEVVQQVL